MPNVALDAPRVYFGVPDLSWGEGLKSKRYTAVKDRATYEELKAHAEGNEGDSLHEADFVHYRVISEQYCEVGDDVLFKNQMWVVSESVISYASGLLQYEYVLVKRQTLRMKLRRNERIQGVSLEGRVVKRANNMVKVHLDIDAEHDAQGNWWFPYSGEGNNIFHCLPEEGARIKVYFPSGTEKQAIAINSVRGGSEEMKSRTVFQKPTTKVFEMPGAAKMQLGDDGVLFEKGTVSLHLDGGNITVNASEDLLLVAGNRMELGSGSEKGVLDPQVLIAEINLLFGAVAIIGAFATGGGSLYLLALADGVIGAGMVAVNIEKLIDLKNGNGNTNPNLLGIDQSMLDNMGLAIAFVNLAFLMKHGLYKAADKLANGRNIVALDELEDALKAWRNKSGIVVEDLDFKLWEEMRTSGQVRLTPDGLRIISIRDMKKFKSEMKAKNIKVIVDKKGTILPEKAVGGFDPNTGQIVLRPDASYLSAVHESYHAKHFGELGKEKYMKLSTLEKEEYVYKEIMRNKDKFSVEEIYEAQRYIFKLRNGEWPPPNWKGFEE
ncbi:zincin-like metallopeptidase toxin domain-containing protein [Paenibacillus durus]|uniref:zincin-like metallopeptidase toxin domain-containing protein n=1 Tax=Paenibacillus durus TaxID=44251 RepID=UPI0006933FCE|nr:zincin-like metallopeptidase toxin domain-containing protein [Paenibacillus durus]